MDCNVARKGNFGTKPEGPKSKVSGVPKPCPKRRRQPTIASGIAFEISSEPCSVRPHFAGDVQGTSPECRLWEAGLAFADSWGVGWIVIQSGLEAGI